MLIGSDAGYRRMFLSGACYNWLVAAVFGLGYRTVFPALGILPMPGQPLYFQLFMFAVAVFGYGYYRVSRDLSQTGVVEIGAIGKLLLFGLIGAHWLAGEASWHLVALASVDFVYAMLFIQFLRSRKARAATEKGVANE